MDFVKTQALGNDFILVQKAAVPERQIQQVYPGNLSPQFRRWRRRRHLLGAKG